MSAPKRSQHRPVPTIGSGRHQLIVLCDSRDPEAPRIAGNQAETGIPVVIVPNGNPLQVSWPPVAKALVGMHEDTSDDALLAIVTAMIDAGIDEVRVLGNNRRDAKTYRAT